MKTNSHNNIDTLLYELSLASNNHFIEQSELSFLTDINSKFISGILYASLFHSIKNADQRSWERMS